MRSGQWTLGFVALFCITGGEFVGNGDSNFLDGRIHKDRYWTDTREYMDSDSGRNIVPAGIFRVEEISKDFCEDVCGKAEGVKCEGDMQDKTTITCTCTTESESYDKTFKLCKVKCKVDAGNDLCECEDDGKCACKDGTSGDKCEEVLGCTDELKKTCLDADAKCVFDEKETNKATCKCKAADKTYVKGSNKCLDTCTENNDCKEKNRECKDKVCVCKEGYGGKDCEEVLGCTDELKKNCLDADADCVFDEKETNKATCKCKAEDKTYVKGSNKCLDTCTENNDCKEKNRECKDKVCVCKEGYGGDKCEEVLGCTDELKMTCLDADAECVFDENETNKASCKCKAEDKTYVKESNKCLDSCKNNVDCGTGRMCKDGVCVNCKEGYGGEDCKELLLCKYLEATCNAAGADCVYDEKEADKATCKCKAKDKTYFKGSNECLFPCSEDKDCKEEGRECKDNVCLCKEGMGGDDCKKVLGCTEEMTAKCLAAEAECVFDAKETNKATCKCKAEDKAYVKGTNKCQVDYCKKCGDKTGVVCRNRFDEKTRCECRDDDKAFDEKDNDCKVNYCKQVCGEKPGVICEGNKFDKESVKCKCKEEGKAFDATKLQCLVDNCFENCGISFDTKDGDVACEGGPFGDKKDIKCTCLTDTKSFDSKVKKCRRACSDAEDCDNGADCLPQGDNKFCKCLDGTTGDFCDTITECTTGKLKECKGDKGRCVYLKDDRIASCECNKETQKFYGKVQHCEDRCDTSDEVCKKDGRICNPDKFCACPDGYSGKGCKEVTGCKALEKICKEAEAECVFDKDEREKANCKCNQEGFVFDKYSKKCLDSFCARKPCKDSSTCELDKSTKAGFCKCTGGKYYDYYKRECTAPDKCLLKKEKCKENEKCSNGKCSCADNYEKEKDGEKCVAKFCKPDPCFGGSTCSEKDGSLCTCKEGEFYNGKECKDGKCISKDFESKCELCPGSFDRKDGKCVPKNDKKACDKGCGYGYCVKNGDKEECKCITSVAELVDGKCVPDAKKVCASGKLTDDSKKCNCTGKYTQAEDGITCELLSCSHEVVKKECAAKGATCQMQWKASGGKEVGYSCKCPTGYMMDKEKQICTDSCSLHSEKVGCLESDQFCYNSASTQNTETGDCRCPPTLKYENGKCSEFAEHVYLVQNIPVLKAAYEMKNKINYVLLNAHLMLSLKQTFNKDIFDYGYLKDYTLDGDVLKCSVWINFKMDPASELKRIQVQPQKFSNESCEGCDQDRWVWPPSLLISEEDLNKVAYEKLTMCSKFPREILCGTEADCNDNKCSCPKGYRTLDYTIKSYKSIVIQRCEDIDECSTGDAVCPQNTECVNIPGGYGCKCKAGFKKVKDSDSQSDKGECSDLCSHSPCKNGKCSMKDDTFDCKCEAGYAGATCEREDLNYASAKKGTVVVGAVLGTILALGLIALLLYYRKVRRSSYSEDFTPSPRRDNPAEMLERRPMRGMINKSYE